MQPLTLFERVKQKAAKTLQDVGNFFNQNVAQPVQQTVQQIPQQFQAAGQMINQGLQDQSVLPDPVNNYISEVINQPVIAEDYFSPKNIQTFLEAPDNSEILAGFRESAFTANPSMAIAPVSNVAKNLPIVNELIGQTGAAKLGPEILERGAGLVDDGAKLVDDAVNAGSKLTKDLFTKAAPIVDDAPKPTMDLFKRAVEEGAATTKPLNFYDRNFLEPTRALKKSLGDVYESANENVFSKLQTRKGDAAVFKTDLLKKVQSVIPFNAGSKESAAIQELGEGVKSAEQIVKQFGPEKAAKIVEGNQFFRGIYDEAIDTVNVKRVADGLEPIAKRDDYYRHFQEEGGSWLDNLISGNNGSSAISSSIQKQRKGEKTVYDAVGGFANWVDQAGRAGFTDAMAPKIQKLGDDLVKNGADPKVGQYLQDYASKGILGEKDADGLNEIVNAGLNVVNAVGKRVRMNQVLFNARSLIMQTANVPTAIGKVLGTDPKGSIYITKGLTNIGKNAEAMAQSPFLRDRGFSVPAQFVKGKINKITDAGGKLLQKTDMLPTKYIWNTFYEQGLAKKVPDAIAYADDLAKQMIGARGIGDLAPAQSSRVGSTVLPFSVEWFNSAHALGDMVGKKEAGALLATLSLYHGFNKLVKGTTGSSAGLFDPIQALMDANEYRTGSDRKEQNSLKAIGTLIAKGADLNPVSANLLSTAYPVAEAVGVVPPSEELFGSEDPTRFGTASLYLPKMGDDVQSTVLNNLKFALPTGGGNQIKKTVEGIEAGNQGYTESAAGNVFGSVPQDPLSRAQMAIFGQWATPDASKGFGNDFTRPLTDEQKGVLDQLPPDQKKAFIDSVNTNTVAINKTKSSQSWFDKLTGKEAAPNFDTLPKSKAELEAYNKSVDIALANGAEIPDQAILRRYFKNKDYSKKDSSDRADILEAMKIVQNDEFLTDEQKARISQAAKIPEGDLEYYTTATMDEAERVENILNTFSFDPEGPREQLLLDLSQMKKKVGGKAIISSDTMVDGLYERGLIDKDEKEFINAIDYDPVYQKFYVDRDYKAKKGSGGTEAQAASKKIQSQMKAFVSSLNSLNKSVINTQKPEKRASVSSPIKTPKAPKLKLPSTRSASTKGSWFKV